MQCSIWRSTFNSSAVEWRNAVMVYPDLEIDDEILNYFPGSANAWIEQKKDNYFDNKVIMRQFEWLFKLIKFKRSFVDHKIEVLLDNARTHTAKVYDINLMNKSAGTNCLYEKFEWKYGDNKKVLISLIPMELVKVYLQLLNS